MKIKNISVFISFFILILFYQNCGSQFESVSGSNISASQYLAELEQENSPEIEITPRPNSPSTSKHLNLPALVSSSEKIEVIHVSASNHDGNIPTNSIDDNLETRWSSAGRGQFIIFDTQKSIQLDSIKVSFYLGDARISNFHVEVSRNGTDFTRIASSLSSSGATIDEETFNISAEEIQFIKIIGLGNSTNNWNSYSEVSLFGKVLGPALEPKPIAAAEAPDLANTLNCSPELINRTVSNFSELSSALNATKTTGGIIRLRPGNYNKCLNLIGRQHTASAPLILLGEGDSSKIKFDGSSCNYTLNIENSSYIQIENISIARGLDAVLVENSDHIIMKQLDISLPKQAGFHVGKNSSFIDIIGNKIYDTGKTSSQYGECIYIGTGSSQNFPDQTENVWISDNDISSCGHGEAINIKSEVFNTTVINNNIYNITPGSSAHSQYNQAAITVESGRGSSASNNHRPNDSRMIWVENNKISNVTLGRWANAIMVGGTGVIVNGNELKNFQESGIYINAYGNLGLPVYLGANTIDASSGHMAIRTIAGVNVIKQNLPVNKNKPQSWGCN